MAGRYRYRLSNTGSGSYRYGPCEICKKPASEVYLQIEKRLYTRPDGTEGWTHNRTLVGHKECLMGIRKQDVADGGKSA